MSRGGNCWDDADQESFFDYMKDEIIVDSITFEEKGKYHFLTITLDKIGGIDLETITAATHIVNDVVDDANITDDSYILDVVSKERGE